jgi:Porin-like glycoporin RafY
MQIRQNALRLTAAAALMAIGGAASALDFSANVEMNNVYGNNGRGLTQGGRVELNANGKAGSNWFVAGKAALEAGKSGDVVTADMWAQVGNKTFDVKLGRFEAVDLFPLPGDVLVESAGLGYGKTNALRGRIGDNVFHAAVGVNLGAGLRAEVGLVDSTQFTKPLGLRPTITYANGPLSLGAGFEIGKFDGVNNSDFKNFGGFAQYDFGGFKLTANAAVGETDGFAGGKNATGAPAAVNAASKSNAFALVAGFGPANVGVITAKTENAAGTSTKENTLYASYALPLFNVKGATLTPAISTSKSGNTTNTGVNVRINYEF